MKDNLLQRIANDSRKINSSLKEVRSITRNLNLNKKEHKRGGISQQKYRDYLNEKHEGHTKQNWIVKSEKFITEREHAINNNINDLINKRFSSVTNINILIIIIMFGFLITSLSPTLIGFVTAEDTKTIIDTTYASDGVFNVDIDLINSLSINGWIDKNFTGTITLNQGFDVHSILDYSSPILIEEVEDSSIDFTIVYDYYTDEVMALRVKSDLDTELPICTIWTIESTIDNSLEKICFGDESCCTFMGHSSTTETYANDLTVNEGKYGADIRNIASAQVIFANYSFDPENAYSDIRYSDIKSKQVNLHGKLYFNNLCGKACSIEANNEDLILDIKVNSGQVHLSNYSYISSSSLNRAPVFSTIRNFTLYKNHTLDLSQYLSDADLDQLFVSYYKSDNLEITIDGLNVFIKPKDDFIGTSFTFFKANDSRQNAISNIVSITVINESEIKPVVVIGRPVKWIKKIPVINGRVELEHIPINVSVSDDGEEISDRDVQIVSEGVLKDLDEYEEDKELELLEKKIDDGFEEGTDVEEYEERLELLEGEVQVSKTGRFFRKLVDADITGNVVLEEAEVTDTILVLDSSVADASLKEVEIEYYTEGPIATEVETETGKEVTISSDIHYENVLAFADVPDTPIHVLKLYHLVDGTRQETSFDGYDTNGDDFVDYIEWIVPHLSNQTFQIVIEIIRAEHLDSNRTYISDIFQDVKALDGNWSESIPSGDYVRVTFEKNLTELNDITVYPRVVNGTPQILIYEFNESAEITRFVNIINNSYNKVILEGLNKTQDVFDLLIINGTVEFDHIIDPDGNNPSIQFVDPTPADGSTKQDNFIYVNMTTSDASPHYSFVDFDDDLHLWLNFENFSGATVFDQSGKGNDGNMFGDALINETAMFGNASWFDGVNQLPADEDGINVSNFGSHTMFDNNFSVSVWAHPNVVSLDNIIGNNQLNAQGWVLRMHTFGEFRAIINDGSAATLNSGGITVGHWYHVVLVRNKSGSFSMFMNGVHTETINSLAGNYSSPDDLMMGLVQNAGRLYDGGLDEVLFWNRSLTHPEILALYNSTVNNYYKNFTKLENKSYIVKGFVIDDGGLMNTTEERNITLGPAPPEPAGDDTNVTDCKTLNSSDTTYTLQNDINAIDTCFNVTANNIVFEGADFTVNLSNGPSFSVGFNATNKSIFTIQNINVTGFDRSVTIESSLVGDGSGDLIIINSTLESAYATGADSTSGGSETGGSAGNITLIESNVTKLYAQGGDSGAGGGAGGAGGLIKILNTNITLSEGEINVTGGLGVGTMGAPGRLILNFSNVFIDKNTGYSQNLSLTMINRSYGVIKYTGIIDARDVSNLSTNVKIKDKLIFVNSTKLSGLNVSANISMYNTPAGDIKVNILRNNQVCEEPFCHNFTSLKAATVDINVSYFSNYTLDDVSNPQISFVSPTPGNDSTITVDHIYANVSSSDLNHHYSFINFNDDLALWMRFDDFNGSDDPTDLSIYGNNGTIGGDTIINDSGYFGSAVQFFGDSDFVNLTQSDSINVAKNFSLSLWGNFLTSSGDDIILAKGDAAANVGCVAGGDTGFALIAESGASAYEYRLCNSTTITTINVGTGFDGLWHHIVLVYNGTGVATYYDNVRSTIALGGDMNTADYFYLGSTGTAAFTGKLDELIMFNKTLTSLEVGALFNASVNKAGANYTNLVNGTFNFTGYAVDRSGNKNSTGIFNVKVEIAPAAIEFIAPTPENGTVIATDHITVNLSNTDLVRHYNILDFNSDLFFWMRMDDVNDSGDPLDISIYGNDGDLEGNAKINSSGIYSNASHHDGNGDYIIVKDDPILGFGVNDLTVSMWVQGTDSDGANLIDKGYVAGDSGRLLVQKINTNARCVFGTTQNITGSVNIGDGGWHHVLCTRNGTNVSLYVDGAFDASVDGAISNLANSDDLYINARSDGTATAGFSVTGAIDEVLIFNRSFSDAEIITIYNGTGGQYANNFTNLKTGVYNFTAHYVDSLGKINNLTRYITTTGIGSCQPLDIGGSNYHLVHDLNATGNCLIVNVQNISIEGDHYYVSGDGTGGGVNASNIVGANGQINLTISNTTISGFDKDVITSGHGATEFPAGNVIVVNSTIGSIYASGTSSSSTDAGDAGDISLFFSNITKIEAIGGTASGAGDDGGDGGNVDIININMNLSNTSFSLARGTGLGTDGISGRITMNFTGYFSDTNATYNAPFYLTIKNASGEIKWLANISSKVQNISRSLSIADDLIYLNSTKIGALNTTANITMHNTPSNGVRGDILRNGHVCGVDCHNFTSIMAATVIFNTTSFSNFTIGDNVAPTIKFVFPTPGNNSFFGANHIYTNLSTVDKNNHYSFLEFDNDLIFWMRFDDLNGTGHPMDLSRNNYTGTLWPSAKINSSGKFGDAAWFTGVGASNISLPAMEFSTTQYTVSAWAKPANDAAGNFFHLGFTDVNDEFVRMRFFANDTLFQNDFDLSIACLETVNTGEWMMVTAAVNNDTQTANLYIDGVSCGTDVSFNNPSQAVLNAYNVIGLRSGGSQIYTGGVDEILIFNRTLTATEVQALYNASVVQFEHNFTGLAETSYTFTGHSVDKFGYRNSTGLYNVTIDLSGPTVDLDKNDTNIELGVESIWINWSATDTQEINTVELNVTWPNGSVLYTSSQNNQGVNLTKSNLTLTGNYTINFWANDSANNVASAIDSFIVNDTMFPGISFVNPTEANNSNVSTQGIYVNLSTDEVNLHYSFIDFDKDLLLWMRMDDVNGSNDPVDISGYQNNGSLNGSALINTSFGIFGSSSSYTSSDDSIVIQDSQSLGLGENNISVSIWVKTSDSDGANFIDKGYVAGDSGRLIVQGTSNNVRCVFGTTQNITGSVVINDDKWHHIVCNRNGTNVTLFVDGSFDASVDGSVSDLTNTDNLYINARSDGNGGVGFSAPGYIDEVMIFNRTLTATEVLALYNASSTPAERNFGKLEDGTHNFTGYTADIMGYKNQTDIRFVNVDTGGPAITGVTDTPDPQGYGLNVSLEATVSDNVGIDAVVIEITPTGGIAINYTMTGTSTYYYNFTTWTNNSYSYIVYANDTLGNWNSSSSATFDVNTNLSIQVKTLKETYGTGEIVNLTDPLGALNQSKIQNNGTTNASIFVSIQVQRHNGTAWNESWTIYNATSNEIINNTPADGNVIKLDELFNGNWNSTLNGTGDGTYRVYAAAEDNNSNVLTNATGNSLNASYNFSVDTTIPGISLHTPLNSSELIVSSINFNYTVTDNIDNLLLCNLTINGVVNASDINSTSGTHTNYTVNGINDGTYSWNVTCSDNAFNSNTSLTFNFTLDTTAPTLVIEKNDTNVEFGVETIWINWSATDASGVDVTIFNVTWPNGTILFDSSNEVSGINLSKENLTLVGNYTLNLWANDTSGNSAVAIESFIVNDTMFPGISFASPTPDNNTNLSSPGIFVNLSTDEVNYHYSFADFDDDVLLWMRMDDVNGSGEPTDISGHQNNGTLGGSAFINTSFGRFGSSSEYSSSGDYILIPDSSSLRLGLNDFTISMWIKGEDTDGGNYIDKGFVAGNGERYTVRVTTNNARCFFGTTQDIIGSAIINDDKWHHIVCNRNGTNVSLFVDGAFDDSVNGTISNFNASDDLYINARSDGDAGATLSANGTIDEIIFFNRSLSLTEILALYNASSNAYQNNFSQLTDGTYNFTGYTADHMGYKNQTGTRLVTIDTGGPSITAVTDTPDPQGYGLNVSLEATVSDNFGIDAVLVEITPTGGIATNYTMTGSSPYYHNFTTWTNSTYTYIVYANDTLGNWNSSVSATFDVNTNLSIQVKTLKETYGTGEIVNLTDPLGALNQSKIQNNGTTNASIFVSLQVQRYNGTAWNESWTIYNATSNEIINNTPADGNVIKLDELFNGNWNSTLNGTGDGTYRVYAAAEDNNSNVLTNATGNSLNASYNFSVDTTIPGISLFNPTNSSQLTEASVNFNYTVTDNVDNLLLCNITINGIVNVSDLNSTSGSPTNYTVNGFNDGAYVWNVTCSDDVLNSNTSLTFNFSIDTSDAIPTPNNLSTNSSDKILEDKQFFANWTDNLGLSSFIFSWNGTTGSWQNDSAVIMTGLINQSNVSKNINLSQSNTIGWTIYANDTLNQFNQTVIQTFVVDNTPPYTVNLTTPANTSAITNRLPWFNWTTAYDPDNDNINYTLQIDEIECPYGGEGLDECIGALGLTKNNINISNHTLETVLGFDAHYNWSIRAYDGKNYSVWSSKQNFTVDGVLSITLGCAGCNSLVDFGDNVFPGVMYNTTSGSPSPLIIENDGNVEVDIRVNASPLWDSSLGPLGSAYFQFMAGNASELNSFNWSNSTISWFNMNSSFEFAIRRLNWSNATDLAEVELNIRIPEDEPAGKKITTMNLEAKYRVTS